MAEATLEILRQDPARGIEPHFEKFVVPLGEDKMTVLQVLEYIFTNQDSSLGFRRYSCGLQSCMSCVMKINGKPDRACQTVVEAGETIKLQPLDGNVIKDLVTVQSTA